MKTLLFTILFAFIALPAIAADTTLTPMEPQYICMVNNTAFDKEQIAVEVEGKTYYGCCSMCKARLQKDASLRTAIDPVSGEEVDKALAVIGVDEDNAVYYFANQENFDSFTGTSSMKEIEHMDGHDMGAMDNMDHMNHDMMDKDMTSADANADAFGTGIIKKIMTEDNKVNMTHAPIAALQWPEMTMDFIVADTVDLSSFDENDNVTFSLKLQDKSYVITDMHVSEETDTSVSAE